MEYNKTLFFCQLNVRASCPGEIAIYVFLFSKVRREFVFDKLHDLTAQKNKADFSLFWKFGFVTVW